MPHGLSHVPTHFSRHEHSFDNLARLACVSKCDGACGAKLVSGEPDAGALVKEDYIDEPRNAAKKNAARQ